MKKKILIVGGQSSIAQGIIPILRENYEVELTGRHETANIYVDLLSLSASSIKESFDVIIHCAASFCKEKSWGSFQKNEEINSAGAFVVAQLAEKTKCKHLIYLGSVSSLYPSSSYDLSKKHGDENLELSSRIISFSYTSLLLSQIYGTTDKSLKNQFLLKYWINQAQNNQDIILYGTKDPWRNFLFQEDVGEIVKRIIDKNIYGRYSCTHPISYRLSQVAKLICKNFNSSSKIIRDPSQLPPPAYKIPKSCALYELIDYTPKISFPEGLKLFKESDR